MSVYEEDDDDRYGDGYADAMRARLRGDVDKLPITIEDVKNMTQDEINANWEDVSAILEQNL